MEPLEIEATLKVNDEEHNLLEFGLPAGAVAIDLDNGNDADQIRAVFAAILEEMSKNDITLKAMVPEDRINDLYGEVCKEYIDQLNSELNCIKPELQELAKEDSLSE